MFDRMFPAKVFDMQREFIRVFEAPRDFVFWSELVEEETQELLQAHDEDEGMEQVLKESADLMYVLCGFYNTMPVRTETLLPDELNETVQARFKDAVECLNMIITNYMLPQYILANAMEIVHHSNMTKVGEDGKPTRSDGSDGLPIGKVLKGPNYVAPDMKPCVEQHTAFLNELADSGQLQKVNEG